MASCLTCHDTLLGGTRNAFGMAVEPLVPVDDCVTEFWGPALAALDSDGDGRTNGEELGDPLGLWRPGDRDPGDPDLVTNPGVPDPPPGGVKVTGIRPAQVSTEGGTAVIISGSGFSPSTAAAVGGIPLEGLNVLGPTSISGVVPALPAGEEPGPRDLSVTDLGITAVLEGGVTYVKPRSGPGVFIRGDVNGNGAVDLTDVISLLSHLFTGGGPPPCPDAADADDSAALDITDAIFVLFYLFGGGTPMPPPFPVPGVDPTPDGLGCTEPPPPPLTDLRVAPSPAELPAVGSTLQLEVTAARDGSPVDVHRSSEGTTYLSSDPAVAAVFRDGLVEARSPGSAAITVRIGTLEAQTTVQVTAAGGSSTVKVLASSEYGLSFLDREFSVFSFHPPHATLRAQAVRAGPGAAVTVLNAGQVDLTYSSLPDAGGSENSRSLEKTDFWSTLGSTYGWAVNAGAGHLRPRHARRRRLPGAAALPVGPGGRPLDGAGHPHPRP